MTAASFKAVFDRHADPKMQSPSGAFMSDIVGASKTPVSGVRVKGNHLIITHDALGARPARAARDAVLLRAPGEHAA